MQSMEQRLPQAASSNSGHEIAYPFKLTCHKLSTMLGANVFTLAVGKRSTRPRMTDIKNV